MQGNFQKKSAPKIEQGSIKRTEIKIENESEELSLPRIGSSAQRSVQTVKSDPTKKQTFAEQKNLKLKTVAEKVENAEGENRHSRKTTEEFFSPNGDEKGFFEGFSERKQSNPQPATQSRGSLPSKKNINAGAAEAFQRDSQKFDSETSSKEPAPQSTFYQKWQQQKKEKDQERLSKQHQFEASMEDKNQASMDSKRISKRAEQKAEQIRQSGLKAKIMESGGNLHDFGTSPIEKREHFGFTSVEYGSEIMNSMPPTNEHNDMVRTADFNISKPEFEDNGERKQFFEFRSRTPQAKEQIDEEAFSAFATRNPRDADTAERKAFVIEEEFDHRKSSAYRSGNKEFSMRNEISAGNSEKKNFKKGPVATFANIEDDNFYDSHKLIKPNFQESAVQEPNEIYFSMFPKREIPESVSQSNLHNSRDRIDASREKIVKIRKMDRTRNEERVEETEIEVVQNPNLMALAEEEQKEFVELKVTNDFLRQQCDLLFAQLVEKQKEDAQLKFVDPSASEDDNSPIFDTVENKLTQRKNELLARENDMLKKVNHQLVETKKVDNYKKNEEGELYKQLNQELQLYVEELKRDLG